jgi:hypothetical protein
MSENIVNGFDFSALPLKIEYVGKYNDNEWPHFLWNVTISNKNGFWTVPYKCGLAHVQKKKGAMPPPKGAHNNSIAYQSWHAASHIPKKPTNSDVIYSLLMDMSADDMSFRQWCDEYGYSSDSISALKTYTTCCEYAQNMRKTFTSDQLEKMRTALEDY